MSEAVRGEGALLVNDDGAKVLEDPLQPRDIVTRAAWAQIRQGRRVFLDARHLGGRFEVVFPSIHAKARSCGIDPATELLPVTPAAHYHMGGVLVNAHGESTLLRARAQTSRPTTGEDCATRPKPWDADDAEASWRSTAKRSSCRTGGGGARRLGTCTRLYAVGEVASTGLHGANRLASNSLLEAVVCGREVARHLALRHRSTSQSVGDRVFAEVADLANVDELRDIMTTQVGVLRDADGLRDALARLRTMTGDAALIASLIAESALRREESLGGHARTDFPERPASTDCDLFFGRLR